MGFYPRMSISTVPAILPLPALTGKLLSKSTPTPPTTRQDTFSLRFCGKNEPVELLDYRSIDPTLTDEEVQAYEDCERQWYKIIEGIEPTEEGLKTLENRAKALGFKVKNGDFVGRWYSLLPDKGVSVNTWLEEEKSLGQLFLKTILYRTNMSYSQQMATLSHEIMHGLHYKNKLLPFKLRLNKKVRHLQNSLLKHIRVTKGQSNAQIPLNKENIDYLRKKKQLEPLKQLLISEVIAHHLASELRLRLKMSNDICYSSKASRDSYLRALDQIMELKQG